MLPRTAHMRPPAVDPARPGLVWPVAVDPDGVTGPTRAQARGPLWERATQRLYLPSDLDSALATDQRIVTAAALLPPGGAITGWAALRWGGARYLDGTRGPIPLPVVLAVPGHAIRAREGIVLTEEADLRRAIVQNDGLSLTSYVAATAFEVRHARSIVDAVGAIDRAAAADLVSLDELRAHAVRIAGSRWVSRLTQAIDLAEENSWSPAETRMRLVWRSIGVTDVVCNRPVFDGDGRFLGTPDLLDLESGTIGEYDGPLHLASSQRAKDIRREGVFRRAGLEYVEMVAADLRDPRDFHARTRDARARARTSDLPRNWTIDPPPWWVPTHTVELRRALSDWQRARFLGWQAS